MSASLGLSPVLSPNLSPTWLCLFTLAGVLCPPRWACLPICLPICLPSGFVFHLGASLGLSPNLSPTWLCLLRWLGCCVRLAGLVSQFVSHLALSFTLAGVLCPPRGACLLIPQRDAVSASLGLSPVLSPTLSPIWSGMLCPPRWSCLSLVCGLVSGLVSGLVCHLRWDAVSASLGCLRSCLPACLPSVWDALSASLVLSFSCLWSCLPAFVFVLSRSLSFIWDAVSAPPGLVFFLSLVLSPGMLCSPSWLVSQPSLSPVFLSHTVFQLVWCVRALGLSPKFHVRFVQLFGVYGGVFLVFRCGELGKGMVSGRSPNHPQGKPSCRVWFASVSRV